MSDASEPPGEDGRIAQLVALAPCPAAPEGPGDDAAVMQAADARRVITVDTMVEGVHFLRAHPPSLLAAKLVAVNLSDVAAMGARPEALLLSAALPPALEAAWWRAFAEGLAAACSATGAQLVGGDTVRGPSGAIVVSVTAWGRLEGPAPPLTRHTGKPGDRLWVLGPVGRSGEGLRRWLQLAAHGDTPCSAALAGDACLSHHLAPDIPLDAGPWARAVGVRCAMDLSDGLATDLPRLARASGVALSVDLAALPDDPALRPGTSVASRAASGEDFGLAILAPPPLGATLAARGFVPLGAASPPGPGGPEVRWHHAGRPVPPPEPDFTHFPAPTD